MISGREQAFHIALAAGLGLIAIILGVVAVTHGSLIGCYAIGLGAWTLGFLAGLTLGRRT